MTQEILDNLFSKDGLHFSDKIHSNLGTKVLSVLLDRKASGLLNQPEYTIQTTISDFLTTNLQRTSYNADTEVRAFKSKRIDNAIIHTNSNSQMVLYEVKTYIKNREDRVNLRLIYSDIVKLAIKKKELPYCKAYMVIAGKTRVFKRALVDEAVLELPHKFEDKNNRSSIKHGLQFFADNHIEASILRQAEALGIRSISIGLSVWRDYKGMAVLIWKINKI